MRFSYPNRVLIGLVTLSQLLIGPAMVWGDHPNLSTNGQATNFQAADIVLDEGGCISGRVVDAQGRAVPQAVVQIQGVSGTTETRALEDGRFQMRGLSGGQYQVRCGPSETTCRLWTSSAAPPHAQPELLIVAQGDTQRAQQPIGRALGSDPVILGAIIISAITVPLIVYDSQDESSASGS